MVHNIVKIGHIFGKFYKGSVFDNGDSILRVSVVNISEHEDQSEIRVLVKLNPNTSFFWPEFA